MNSPRTVRIGRTPVAVPDSVRLDLAEEIAEQLTAQLAEIEAKAQKVDTLTFALQLAFENALRYQQQADAYQDEQADLIRELLAVNEQLEALLAAPKDGAPPSGPIPKSPRRPNH